jgi:hypothetical protein
MAHGWREADGTAVLTDRSRWLCALLCVFIGINALVLARRIVAEWPDDSPSAMPDAIAAFDDAVRLMLPYLPAYGQVGYIKEGFSRANLADLEAFGRAQYSLAPRVLVVGAAPDVVVAVAHGDSQLPEVPVGFEEMRTFSGRLALYRRRP